jgi:hypothetical protein
MPISWHSESQGPPPFSEEEYLQLTGHIRSYAEQLYSWELYQRRAELLKVIHLASDASSNVAVDEIEQYEIGEVIFYKN